MTPDAVRSAARICELLAQGPPGGQGNPELALLVFLAQRELERMEREQSSQCPCGGECPDCTVDPDKRPEWLDENGRIREGVDIQGTPAEVRAILEKWTKVS